MKSFVILITTISKPIVICNNVINPSLHQPVYLTLTVLRVVISVKKFLLNYILEWNANRFDIFCFTEQLFLCVWTVKTTLFVLRKRQNHLVPLQII
jgi:ABC-type transport system involved in cytochrome c biogenesis permease subunit